MQDLCKTNIDIIIHCFTEAINIFQEFQGAFRKERKAEVYIFALKSRCSISKSNKAKTYLSFLYITKVFDTLIVQNYLS